MAKNGILQYLIRSIQSLYVKNKILIGTGRPNTTPCVINYGVYDKGAHYLLPFLIYIRRCHKQLADETYCVFYDWAPAIDTLLLAGDQTILKWCSVGN